MIVNTSDSGGGAERVAFTLAEGLRSRGHSVTFLCSKATLSGSKSLMGKIDWVIGRLMKRIGWADLFSLASITFLKREEVREADVIHFHNVHGFYFGIASLPNIFKEKPSVWTLHDKWALTGGCYLALNCKEWQRNCGSCPQHGVFPMTGFLDTSGYMLKSKREAFRSLVNSGGIFTGVSAWITKDISTALASAGLHGGRVECVKNCVDIEYRCTNSSSIKFIADLKVPVILLVAADITNPFKGMKTALSAISLLNEVDFRVIVVGEPFGSEIIEEYCLADKVIQLGRINDRNDLNYIYSNSTVTVVPSDAESFSLVTAESLACMTPVVASNVAALPELVINGITGYLAERGDSEDFSRKIHRVLTMADSDYANMQRSIGEFVDTQLVTFEDWLDNYESVYKEAVSQHETVRGKVKGL